MVVAYKKMPDTSLLFRGGGCSTNRNLSENLTRIGIDDRYMKDSATRRQSSVLPTPVGPVRTMRVLFIERSALKRYYISLDDAAL